MVDSFIYWIVSAPIEQVLIAQVLALITLVLLIISMFQQKPSSKRAARPRVTAPKRKKVQADETLIAAVA